MEPVTAITEISYRTKKTRDHILGLVDPKRTDNAAIRLCSARNSQELILVFERETGAYKLSQKQLEKAMAERSWRTFHRTIAHETARGCYELTANSEILVGDESITQPGDIEHLVASSLLQHNSDNYLQPSHKKLLEYINKLKTCKEDDVVSQTVSDADGCCETVVTFDSGPVHRRHKVRILESEGYCVLLSDAVTAHKITGLGEDRDRKVIEHTWIRNRYVDIVEFLLSPSGSIAGRVIHPIDSLDWPEFYYCIKQVAIECDRLEYVFEHEDVL